MQISKLLLVSLVCVATVTAQKSIFKAPNHDKKPPAHDETLPKENKLTFIQGCVGATWTGLITGWYHSSHDQFAPTEACFGGWIEEDFKEIKDLAKKMSKLDFMELTFEEVSNGAVDIVELFFK